MCLYRALCIKELEHDGIMQFHYWRKDKIYDVISKDDTQKTYTIESEYGKAYVSFKDFSEHFQKIPTYVRIRFMANFQTDGDFCFEEERLRELEKSPLYGDANIEYHFNNHIDYENILFTLTAEGKNYDCRYALRDLLEEMMCSIRTSKYWLVKNIYGKLEKFHEAIWSNKDVDIYEEMSGNYSGTEMCLTITEIQSDEIRKVEEEEDKNTGWLEVVVQDYYIDASSDVGRSYGDVKKLQCPHCSSIHPDSPYVRNFKHCPDCGEELK